MPNATNSDIMNKHGLVSCTMVCNEKFHFSLSATSSAMNVLSKGSRHLEVLVVKSSDDG
jgi:VCBS repeat-containing protein